ncbi:MAG: M23 family metallopeptidase [Gemmatimonadaceae bacterium]
MPRFVTACASRTTGFLLWLAPLGYAAAQQRSEIVQSVDLLVPVSPAVVAVGGVPHLVHELHITNLQSAEIAITRLQVIGDAPNATLGDFRDSALASILARPGLRRGQVAVDIMPPGSRTVAYFWIPLVHDAAPPRVVRHRLELSVRRSADTVSTTFEGAESSVSRQQPVVLDPPLRGGPWVAIYDPLLIGGHRTAFYTIDGRARIPARYAIDWIRLPASGTIDKPDAADRNGFGADVLAVADGIIASAVDDTPDNEGAPTPAAHRLENASGNYIAIDLGDGRFAFYEHLKRGSIRVKKGDRVRRGQVIAQLGNSGSSSIGPHLHFHVSDANHTLAAEGLPFVFRRFEQLGAFRSIAALIAGERWAPAAQRENIRIQERPIPNAVLRFP